MAKARVCRALSIRRIGSVGSGRMCETMTRTAAVSEQGRAPSWSPAARSARRSTRRGARRRLDDAGHCSPTSGFEARAAKQGLPLAWAIARWQPATRRGRRRASPPTTLIDQAFGLLGTQLAGDGPLGNDQRPRTGHARRRPRCFIATVGHRPEPFVEVSDIRPTALRPSDLAVRELLVRCSPGCGTSQP